MQEGRPSSLTRMPLIVSPLRFGPMDASRDGGWLAGARTALPLRRSLCVLRALRVRYLLCLPAAPEPPRAGARTARPPLRNSLKAIISDGPCRPRKLQRLRENRGICVKGGGWTPPSSLPLPSAATSAEIPSPSTGYSRNCRFESDKCPAVFRTLRLSSTGC